jgi:hypothetical protein
MAKDAHTYYCVKLQLPNSMEQSPSWEAKSHSGNKEITCPSWNLKIQCCVNKGSPLAPTLSQINPINFSPYFPKIHSYIMLPLMLMLMLMSSKWFPPFRFSDQNSMHFSPLPCVLYDLPISSSLIWYP